MQNTDLVELESQDSPLEVQILWVRVSNITLADEIRCNYLKHMLTGFTASFFFFLHYSVSINTSNNGKKKCVMSCS